MEDIINWRRYFTSLILSRARLYYNRGAVKNVIELDSNSYIAIVHGTTDYSVFVKKTGKSLSFSCTCPYESGYCKHEAALCFYLDFHHPNFFFIDATPKKKTTRTMLSAEPVIAFVSPFSKAQDENCYFSIGRLFGNVSFAESDYQQAKALVEHHSAILQDTAVSFDFVRSRYTKVLSVKVSIDELGETRKTVSVLLSRDEICDLRCSGSDSKCSGYRSPYSGYSSVENYCKHKIAALILINQYIKKENPGDDATDRNAYRLISALKNSKKSFYYENIENNLKRSNFMTIDIVPQLDYSFGALSICFSIGETKKYKVKNIGSLMSAKENKVSLFFGRDLTIDFKCVKLSDRAERCFKFFSFFSSNCKNSISLFGSVLDLFFDLFTDVAVEFANKDSREVKLAELRETTSDSHMIINSIEEEGKFLGYNVTVETKIDILTESYGYIVEQNVISRFPLESLGALGFTVYDKSFTIGIKYLNWFWYDFVPQIRDFCTIEGASAEQVKQFLTPEPSFRFYLDYENSSVKCRCIAEYENLSHEVKPVEDFEEKTPETNISREAELKRSLENLFPEFSDNVWSTGRNEDRIYLFMRDGISYLSSIGEVNVSDTFSRLKTKRIRHIKASVKAGSAGLLDFQIDTDDISNEEFLEILESYRKRKIYHKLKSGRFIQLEDEDLQQISGMFKELGISKKNLKGGTFKIPSYRSLFLESLVEKNTSVIFDRNAAYKKILKDFDNIDKADYIIPKSLDSVLRPYQKDGFKWLRTLYEYGFGGILADEMGLGKTIQVQALLQSLKDDGKCGSNIVICPASLVYNWKEEINRYTPDLSVLVVSGPKESRQKIIDGYSDFDILITSYDLLKRDIEYYQDKSFNICVLDEAQYIKNSNTDVSKATKALKVQNRFALTGTPIENYLSELWSIFDFLMPDFLFNYATFKNEFEMPIVNGIGKEYSERLKKMIFPFILRRLKADVLEELPEKIEKIIYSEMNSEQKKLYNAHVAVIVKNIKSKTASEFNTGKLQVLAELTKLRQICCNPSLIFENYKDASAKTDTCLELIHDAIDGGHKILLFSQFTSMLEILEYELKEHKIAYFKLTGETGKEERLKLVNKFNSGNVPVFLISLKAGGTGLNLTGADVVIHYDPWWNVAVQNQATDRTHRIGQKNVVTVYKLILHGTVEEKIVELQESKKHLAEEMLSDNTVSMSKLTKDDLLELLSY